MANIRGFFKVFLFFFCGGLNPLTSCFLMLGFWFLPLGTAALIAYSANPPIPEFKVGDHVVVKPSNDQGLVISVFCPINKDACGYIVRLALNNGTKTFSAVGLTRVSD